MPYKHDANAVNAENQGMQTGIRVLSYLIAGIVFYGGLGWLGDRWLHTIFLLPLGMVLGTAGAIYLIIRTHRDEGSAGGVIAGKESR